MSLSSWGHSAFFGSDLAEGETLGRVLEEQRTQFTVITLDGRWSAQLSGRLLHPKTDRLERPVVGDWVVLRPVGNEKKAVIQSVLPRKTLLKRKAPGTDDAIQPLAANVDVAFVVTSANRDYNAKRIDRYLTLVLEAGARPYVLLTKADLDPDGSAGLAAEIAEKHPCLLISAQTGQGLPELRALLEPTQTYVFLGSSGVGKSTLINELIGSEELSTNGIRNDDRGRHTTTSRRLMALPNGALVIDTPGLREIQLDAEAASGLEARFAAVAELARACRFSNCAHETEPGCAVKEALAEGRLSPEDMASFVKLRTQVKSVKRERPKKRKADYQGND